MATAISPDLGALARIDYRASFSNAVANHGMRPLVLPWALLGPMILPPLWLAIPHTKRPWVYRTRWLVVGLIVALDFDLIRSVSSYNVASAYGAGLMGSWGILHTLDLLVWTRPQFDAARIVKAAKSEKAATDVPSGMAETRTGNGALREDGVRQRKPNNVNGRVSQGSKDHAASNKGETEYVWQLFPENGSFLQRLNWSADFVTNYRCIGWNCCITSVPRPKIPARIRDGDTLSLDSMPTVSRSGCRRSLTVSEFLWSRVRVMAVQYMILDCLATFMIKDPYFVFGPERSISYELPSYLNRLPSWALLSYRELISLAGIYGAIDLMFNFNDVFQYYAFSPIFPIRKEFWHYPSIWGSFSQVLDRGLAGGWGAFWHQTFRLQFSAPATYLVKNGFLTKGTLTTRIVTMYVAFLQSGLLHASGSISSMPETKIWRSPVFFLLQPLGIMIQQMLFRAIDTYLPRFPKVLRRAISLVSTLAWMQMTAFLFCDDIASTGLWLHEPVPFSPLRLMGFGHPDDHWQRWNKINLPTWYWGKHWWTSGVQI
ncbi:hypothetical protein B0T10DRAFT_454090 [Thelonectria olida]|uniref:Wax synthase domain-containing protein n=1 Tax=Thelonectria olida TaxID=1576542 RepID=A0A9P9ASY2_9HYPO|nr:hypothetical protein B0T10DRAFT_454090 [Thelonectria olida]